MTDQAMTYEEEQLRKQNAALRETLQGLAALNATMSHDLAASREALAQVTQERDEFKEMSDWFNSLVSRAQIGTARTPSLRSYIEQCEAKIAEWQERQEERRS